MADIVPKDLCEDVQRPKRRGCTCEEDAAARKMVRTSEAPKYITLAEEVSKDYDSEVSDVYNATFHGRETDYIDSSGSSDIEEPGTQPPPPVLEIVEYEIASPSSNEDCFPNDSTSESEDFTMNENGPNRPIGPYIAMCRLGTIVSRHPIPPIGPRRLSSVAPIRVASVIPVAPVNSDTSGASVVPVAPVNSDTPVASTSAAPIDHLLDFMDNIPSISDYDTFTSSGYHDDGVTDSGPSDSDHDLADFWKCARCDYKQNDVAFRFCDNCFAIRTKHFPKRPKGRKHKLSRKRGVHYPRPRRSRDSGSSGLSNSSTSYADDRVKQGNIENNVNLSKATKRDSGLSSSGSSRELLNSQEMLDVGIGGTASLATTLSNTTMSSQASTSSLAALQSSNILPLSEASTSLSGVPIPSCSGILGSFERNLELLSARAKRRSASNPDEESDLSSGLCMMCSKNPKNGVFVHKKLCHVCCCYACAVKIWNERKQCPICNGKVSNVLQLYHY